MKHKLELAFIVIVGTLLIPFWIIGSIIVGHDIIDYWKK